MLARVTFCTMQPGYRPHEVSRRTARLMPAGGDFPVVWARGSLWIQALVLFGMLSVSAQIAPVMPYDWKPVRVGAGGFVTGMTLHPMDPDVRYARTDVGNGYRWDAAASQWIPMIVRHVEDGTGLAAEYLGPPMVHGVESIQVDPSNRDVVYMAFILRTSNDVRAQYPGSSGALYKSTDRGVNFTRTGLNVPMQPNGPTRSWGERIAVDPNNSDIVYYGSVANGLHASIDGAGTWSQIVSGDLITTANVINIVFDRRETVFVGEQERSATVYAAVANGGVFRSTDGGVTWASISSGTTLEGLVRFMTIGPDGVVHVVKRSTKELWQFANNTWVVRTVGVTWGSLGGVAVDQTNPNRMFTMSDGGSISRSLNGGANWVSLANEFLYANTFAWLPQYTNGFRSNGGVYLDATNRLWSPQGNEGVLTYTLSPSNAENGNPKIQWTIQSQGIEELVGHDVIIPPGSGDKPVISVHDATAFFVDDPDQFTAAMAQLQDQLISNGIGLSYCPNEPSYVVVFSSDANVTKSGRNYSGYSTDSGRTWIPFGSQPIEYRAGQIAVSRRDGWGLGQDRIVILPSQGRAPKYSHDGGQTWYNSTGVAVGEGGDSMSEGGMINFAVRQRLLLADPLVANKFYLGSLSGQFYVSTDGGITWTPRTATGLAPGRFHAQMEANRSQSNDIWYVSGWEGVFAGRGVSATNMYGLFRTSDEGASFQRNASVEYAICLALGAGSGQPGDAIFSVYFYGKLKGDPQWGIFRSVDEGTSWTRVAYYPSGIFDWPSMMAASWDTFGLLYVTMNGNTAVYGRPSGSLPPQFVSSLPADQTVNLGETANFAVLVMNQPAPVYQWQRKNPGQTDWEDIAGASTSSLAFTSTLADNGVQLRVIATNVNGLSTSRVASLSVNNVTAPVIDSPPHSQSVAIGATATFTVQVSGSPTPAIEWQRRTNSTAAWIPLAGATGSTYIRVMTLADDGTAFRVRASNFAGTVFSGVATLSLQPLAAFPSASPPSGPAPLVVGFEPNPVGGRFEGALDTTDDVPGAATARGAASTQQAASAAFDNSISTYWRDNTPDTVSRSSWIHYAFSNGIRRTIASYAIQAFDGTPPKRDSDPADWDLLGSNDGITWTTLDTRNNQSFTRGQRRIFTVAQPGNYGQYRLNIRRVRSPANTTYAQMAELELLRSTSYVYGWDFDDGQTFPGAFPTHTFTNEGSYTVRLTVTDSRSTADALLTIQAASMLSPYERWSHEVFTPAELADLRYSDSNADPDNDGWVNFTEYALGRSPFEPESDPPFTASMSEGVFTLEFPRVREDVIYTLRQTRDLFSSWQILHVDPGAVHASEPQRHTVDTEADQPGGFYRLELHSRE